MHDYMKALYHRFETPSRRAEYLDRKIKRTHNQLTRLLDKPGRKLLLRIADMEDELRDEACLNSFMSGYRLAQGIQQELLADQPPYSFEEEDERQACESWERRGEEFATYPLIEGAHLPSRYNRYMMYAGCPAVFAAIAVTA